MPIRVRDRVLVIIDRPLAVWRTGLFFSQVLFQYRQHLTERGAKQLQSVIIIFKLGLRLIWGFQPGLWRLKILHYTTVRASRYSITNLHFRIPVNVKKGRVYH